MKLKIPTHDNKVRSITLDANVLNEMADHLTGNKLSRYRENIYDADGDGIITLRDFIHRTKNVAGVEETPTITKSMLEGGGMYITDDDEE